jgi:hypothetical protein
MSLFKDFGFPFSQNTKLLHIGLSMAYPALGFVPTLFWLLPQRLNYNILARVWDQAWLAFEIEMCGNSQRMSLYGFDWDLNQGQARQDLHAMTRGGECRRLSEGRRMSCGGA